MKKVFHGGRKRRPGFTERSCMALALVFVLMIIAPFLSYAAEESHSLTVQSPGTEDFPEDLAKAGIVIDLYQVAVAADDSDGYSFTLCVPFDKGLILRDNMKAEDWLALTQDAAGIALKSDAAGGVKPCVEGADMGVPVKDLEAGLYLWIPRGKDLADYIGTNDDGDIVTRAHSDGYDYTFLPGLVSLPGRDPESGEWIDDMEVVLKVEREENEQYGSVRIVKTLDGYNGDHGPAIFIFDVEAVLDGKNVYSNVVTMVFEKAGQEKLLVEGIPVGAKVTVTEVYSGSSYTLVTDRAKNVTINTVQDIPEVSFTNRYDERPNGGHGITNHFRFEKDGWKLDQIFDKTQG